jgi:hypothetical protein
MSYYEVYIGDLGDPNFHWPFGNENAALPNFLSPRFPDNYNHDLYFKIFRDLEAGIYAGGQVD